MSEEEQDAQKSIEPDETEGSEGADEGQLQVSSLEKRVLPDKNDRSLSELHRWLGRGRLIVDPEWQRQYVWDTKRASKLIESFLIDLPIPVVYLAANSSGNYEVIDGLQRLTSVFNFFQGSFSLTGLEIQASLNGQRFSDLDQALQHKLEDATIRTFELPATTDKDLMFLIFERLNTGGLTLNEMEIRNCLYRGKLNDLVKRLSLNDDFIASTNQKNLAKRMLDRSLVLRFLAFYQMTYTKAKKGMKSFLNEFLETYRNPNEQKLKEFEEKFCKSMRLCLTVFGTSAFRTRPVRERSKVAEWAPRLNATIFQIVSVSFTEYDSGAVTRASDAIREEYLDMLATDEEWVSCVTYSTGDYQRIEYAFATWNLRLKGVMDSSPPNDKVRGFSKELKNELWQQNRTCELCSQEIRVLDDSAVDHVTHYWRGGQTIPENARLVHCLCNFKRPQ